MDWTDMLAKELENPGRARGRSLASAGADTSTAGPRVKAFVAQGAGAGRRFSTTAVSSEAGAGMVTNPALSR